MTVVSAKHASSGSAQRKAIVIVVAAVALVGLVSAFGPLWAVRLGLAFAVLGAAGTAWFAFSELRRIEVLQRSELKAVKQVAAARAAAHHTESMDLISTFQHRTRAHGEQLAGLRAQLAGLQQELSMVRGNLLSARNEASLRLEQISQLQMQLDTERALAAEVQAQLVSQQADLAAEVKAAQEDPDVVTLPRRVVSRKALAAQLPSAGDLWRNGDHPTAVNEALTNLPELLRKRA